MLVNKRRYMILRKPDRFPHSKAARHPLRRLSVSFSYCSLMYRRIGIQNYK